VTNQKKKNPPTKQVKSLQFDLFKQFVTNDQSTVSNTVEIWEKIPKYFFTPKQIESLRPEKGQPDPYKWSYKEGGNEFTVFYQAALIEEKGAFKAYFPSVTEELVEEALKKILTEQNQGIHDAAKHETWVRFSLSMIHSELKARGRERNRNQIKHAIKVMSRTIITLYKGKKEVWSGSILQDLVTVDREEYIDDSAAYHIARLPLFVSQAINRLETRQFNYKRLMSCNNQLSRWIYKRLINRFRQADFTNSYHFMYSDLKQSGLLQQSAERSNRTKVIAALSELINQSVVIKYEKDDRKEGRSIIDTKYTLYPTKDFIAEQKAANKQNKNSRQAALESGWESSPVDK